MRRLSRKFWHNDAGLTSLLIVLFLYIFVLYPLVDFPMGRLLVNVLFSLILISGVLAVMDMPLAGWVIGILAVLGLISRTLAHIYPGDAIHLVNAVSSVVFMAILIAVILVQVFREGPVNAHRIAGSVAAYLLIGVLWGVAYVIVELQSPDAFTFQRPLSPADYHVLQLKFVYFSFITLTSVGYGDIVPVHPAGQTLAMMEALVGQLFPTILLARLVSLEIEHRETRRREQERQL